MVLVSHDLNLSDLMMTNSKTLGPMNALPYCNSKYANSLFIKELTKRLKGSKVTAYSLCPGVFLSNLFRGMNKTQFHCRVGAWIIVNLLQITPQQV